MDKTQMPVKLERNIIYESDWICLYADKVQMPDGRIIESYHRLHYPKESVCVVIVNEKDEILLIRSKRYTSSQIEWEVPAGSIEQEESPQMAAEREVMEETGYSLQNLVYLCGQNPSNGMSDEKIHIFGARVKEPVNAADINEVFGHNWFSKEKILSMLKKNEIQCGATMLALCYAIQFYI